LLQVILALQAHFSAYAAVFEQEKIPFKVVAAKEVAQNFPH